MATYTSLGKVATLLAPTASTGNNTHTGVAYKPGSGYGSPVGIQFVVEVAGATPTVTWKAQGSLDGTNWYDVLYISDSSDTAAATTKTATAVGAQVIYLSNTQSRGYSFYRIVTSANTNITYRAELWVETI